MARISSEEEKSYQKTQKRQSPSATRQRKRSSSQARDTKRTEARSRSRSRRSGRKPSQQSSTNSKSVIVKTLKERVSRAIPSLPSLPTPSPIPARVYKRWIFFSVIITFGLSWLLLPFWIDTRIVPEKLSQISEFLFESAILKLIPAGGLFGGDASLLGNVTSILQPFWKNEYEELNSPGRILRGKGARVKHPVVMIPGITSTGLELWQGQECAHSYFRQRLWGTLSMMRFMIMDGACWMHHLKLDPQTGGDPSGIKLRPAQGLEAADFLLPGFWVWARIIENLAEIGYDHNSLMMAPYDWRLDVTKLEERDHYFTRLKAHIELLVQTRREKAVVYSHSLGGIIWLYFMKWVESNEHGRGGKDWVAKHIHAVGSIGAPYLGVPKGICMIMSGEMRDTAQMGKFESFLLDMLMNKKERLGLFRTWMGGLAMLPKGGSTIWGNGKAETMVDTAPGVGFNLVRIKGVAEKTDSNSSPNQATKIFTYNDINQIMADFLPEGVYRRLPEAYAFSGIAKPQEIKANDKVPATWTNPLQSQLPDAPQMTIYCFYGVGKDTERGYEYEEVPEDEWLEWQRQLDEAGRTHHMKTDIIKDILLRYRIDLTATSPDKRMYTGIYHVDGDGTVPTLSNGYMCAHGWKRYKHLNPGGVKVVAREYLHEPSGSITEIRGGPRTSDHVDILGNHEMTMDILKIASGWVDSEGEKGDLVPERIYSQIECMAERIKLPFEKN